jgi:protein O-mannosyl-transferase
MAADRKQTKAAPGSAMLAGVLLLLVSGTFLPCLWNDFINFDDPLYVTDNPHVKQGLTWESFKWAWSSVEAQNWHPLTWLSHMLDAQFFGVNPMGHHAGNVFLHAMNTALLFLLLHKMTGARWRSFAVAALFGLHPLRVESVAWVAERKDVLSVLFWLLTTRAYVRYTEMRNPAPSSDETERRAPSRRVPDTRQQRAGSGDRRSIRSAKSAGSTLAETADATSSFFASRAFWYCAAVAFFACGLLAKPMLVTLPFALLLLDYWPLRRWPQTSVQRLVLEKIPFLILAIASSVVTYLVQEHGGAVTPADTVGLSARFANALVSYLRYIGMSFWPSDLCFMYLHPGNWPAATVTAAGMVLAAVTAIAIWRRQTMPWLAVGWLWFAGTLVPVIGIVQVGRQALADRYTYIPSIGFWLAVVWSTAKLIEKWRYREKTAWTLGVAGTVACITLTVHQIGFWKDNKALYSHARNSITRNWFADAWLAKALEHDGELDAAAAMYQESLQINPRHTEVRCGLGDLLAKQQRYDEALAQFQTAVKLDPTEVYSHYRLGGISQNLGHYDAAIDEYSQVIRLKPDFADVYSDLGNCYGMTGRTDDAIRSFEQAVKLKPGSAQNHRELGVGLANAKRWDEAIAQFQAALQLDPSDTQAQGNLNAAFQARSGAVKGTPP